MKQAIARTWAPVLAGALLLALNGGCAWSVGSPSKADRVEQEHATQPPTKGQQLIDLKKALDQGAMTLQEYDTAKAKLLKE